MCVARRDRDNQRIFGEIEFNLAPIGAQKKKNWGGRGASAERIAVPSFLF